MPTTVLHPVGALVTGLTLDDARATSELPRLLAEHGVVVLPDQPIDNHVFLSFLQRLGELTFTAGETPVDGFPDLNVITNVGRTTPPRSVFHVDTSYVRQPPAYTALRAVEIPARGGQTLFTSQYRAYDTLAADVRDRLAGRTVRHVVTGVAVSGDDETAAEHPVFLRHPSSGRTALFLSTPERCVEISGLDAAQSRETIAYLYEHSTRPDNVYRHTWSPGDVVIWDNRCVMHRADHADVVGRRVMHRGMVTARAGG